MLRLQWGKQPKFKRWILLEQQKEKIVKAIESGEDFPDELFSFLSIALGVRSNWYENADWMKIVKTFYLVLSKLPQVDLPILTPTNEKPKDGSWEYEGRSWHQYSHILAKAYGWTLEYISCLQVKDALAKIQEVIVDDQLEKEFIYGLSEIAYKYDKSSKTSSLVPLPRPHWMRTKVKSIPRFLIPKSMMPMGIVMADKVLPEEYMPKEIH